MANPYRPLPPLPPLRTFEAVARQASFTRAADELAITQSAVSHQIRSLERDLGVALFQRSNPGISLTDDGRTLLEGVRAGFDTMLLATERVRSRHRVGVLTVAAPGAFATWWLGPRLGRCAAAHPHIEIRIAVMDHREPDFRRDGIDAAVVMRAPGRRGPHEMPLLRERIFPVCSPALVQCAAKPLRRAADLVHQTLIEEDEPASPGLGWSAWLSRSTPRSGACASASSVSHCRQRSTGWASRSAARPWWMPSLRPAGWSACSGRSSAWRRRRCSRWPGRTSGHRISGSRRFATSSSMRRAAANWLPGLVGYRRRRGTAPIGWAGPQPVRRGVRRRRLERFAGRGQSESGL